MFYQTIKKLDQESFRNYEYQKQTKNYAALFNMLILFKIEIIFVTNYIRDITMNKTISLNINRCIFYN